MGGMGTFCPWNLCIMLYMQLIQCSGLPEIYAKLDGGWGQSVMKLMQCSGLPEISAQLEGVGSICHI